MKSNAETILSNASPIGAYLLRESKFIVRLRFTLGRRYPNARLASSAAKGDCPASGRSVRAGQTMQIFQARSVCSCPKLAAKLRDPLSAVAISRSQRT
jgi:hypothetical protein